MDKKTILLRGLLIGLDGCKDPNCKVCTLNREHIKELAKELGIDANDIMPDFLKEGGR